jgi:hypothetical protein
MNWYVGDLPVATLKPTDPKTKAPVNPTTVKLTVASPAGQVTEEMSKVGEGEYKALIDLSEEGRWRLVFKTTGTYQGVTRHVLTVRAP